MNFRKFFRTLSGWFSSDSVRVKFYWIINFSINIKCNLPFDWLCSLPHDRGRFLIYLFVEFLSLKITYQMIFSVFRVLSKKKLFSPALCHFAFLISILIFLKISDKIRRIIMFNLWINLGNSEIRRMPGRTCAKMCALG